MARKAEPDLEQILTGVDSGVPLLANKAGEQREHADLALWRGDYADAIDLYAAISNRTDKTRAKHGYCLARLGCGEEAEQPLTVVNVGSHA